MEVTVTIPTYRTRPTVWRLLASLEKQSYRRFSIDVIYKESDDRKRDRKVLDRLKENKKLSIRLVKQYPGLFEEAMNTAFNKTGSDIVINTDDDAYASNDWVLEHVKVHKKHRKVGMATGKVVEKLDDVEGFEARLNLFLHRQKWRLNNHTLIDRPIDEKFNGYGMYIGKSGMLVDTGRKQNMINTFKQHGVNMSWKREALEGFRLPGYTKQGGRNEAAAAIECIDRGYSAVWFDGAINHHPLIESDSRSASLANIPRVLTAESVVFAYYTSKKFDIDIDTLRLRTAIDDRLARLITKNKNDGYSIGYGIAKAAIDGAWAPAKVRATITKRLAQPTRFA